MDQKLLKWVTSQDGLDRLERSAGLVPMPSDGQVLVRIAAVSLNYRDLEVCNGSYTHNPSLTTARSGPITPCSDMCGVIIAVGKDTEWKIGDRVISTFNQDHLAGKMSSTILQSGLGLPLDGVLQTHRVFAPKGLVRAPAYLTDEEAACLPIAAVTAWMAVNQFRPLGCPGGKGEVVLIQGTGGVAISALQIAHAAGATTIITSSSDEKLARAKKLGADHTINYRTNTDWDKIALEMTGYHGADVIVETGGAQTIRKSFAAVAFGGTIAAIGYTSGKQDDSGDLSNINVLALSRTATLKGIVNGPKDRFEEMIEFYTEHKIHPVVDKTFVFDKAREAFHYIADGLHFGKVVIKMNQPTQE